MDSQETRIFIAIIITAVVVGIIIVYFAISIIRQQRKNLELQKANALAEISAMEKERARIAADLHDELGPVLSVIKFQVDNVELVDKEEKRHLNKASQQLDELIAKLREVANNLMPSALHRKGLMVATREFLNNVETTAGLRAVFSYDEHLYISEERSINVFRIVQELMHNCMKHAGATETELRITEKNGLLTIFFRDNGRGFDIQKTTRESLGIGLRSLRNRTEIMGGKMEMESVAGKGTIFIFEIPLK